MYVSYVDYNAESATLPCCRPAGPTGNTVRVCHIHLRCTAAVCILLYQVVDFVVALLRSTQLRRLDNRHSRPYKDHLYLILIPQRSLYLRLVVFLSFITPHTRIINSRDRYHAQHRQRDNPPPPSSTRSSEQQHARVADSWSTATVDCGCYPSSDYATTARLLLHMWVCGVRHACTGAIVDLWHYSGRKVAIATLEFDDVSSRLT